MSSRLKARLSLSIIYIYSIVQGFLPPNPSSLNRRLQRQHLYHAKSSHVRRSSLITALNGNALKDDNVMVMERKQINQSPTAYLEEIDNVVKSFGLPWTSSISDDDDDDSSFLYYMPFWEWQLSFMKENLTDLRIVDCISDNKSLFPNSNGKSFTYKESNDNDDEDTPKSRIISLCFQSKEYRKIRMTFYENGVRGQSFNTVWYPDYAYNMPILGVNLLSKSRENKHLAMIDFQTLYKDEDRHTTEFSHILESINSKYYDTFPNADESDRVWKLKVFSENMFCGRFQDEDYVLQTVYPAYCDYVTANVDLIKSTKPDMSKINIVKQRHKAYDTYSAIRDPCTALLGKLFGKVWADEFVFGFLYSLSERTEDKDYWDDDDDDDL